MYLERRLRVPPLLRCAPVGRDDGTSWRVCEGTSGRDDGTKLRCFKHFGVSACIRCKIKVS